ncbi:MAG TPA: hypothetical protein VFE05_10545 [Longimicrobiaceae bacterium]|jgi:hypothetical protein|nr:hypothetical protein [Longimicrobiaceae bacterium]
MTERNIDPAFDPEEIEDGDPYGEQAFAEAGFADAAGGGPDFSAPGLVDDGEDRRPGGGQKVAGVPEERQHEINTPSADRPDSESVAVLSG